MIYESEPGGMSLLYMTPKSLHCLNLRRKVRYFSKPFGNINYMLFKS